jgi:hypothetical protein
MSAAIENPVDIFRRTVRGLCAVPRYNISLIYSFADALRFTVAGDAPLDVESPEPELPDLCETRIANLLSDAISHFRDTGMCTPGTPGLSTEIAGAVNLVVLAMKAYRTCTIPRHSDMIVFIPIVVDVWSKLFTCVQAHIDADSHRTTTKAFSCMLELLNDGVNHLFDGGGSLLQLFDPSSISELRRINFSAMQVSVDNYRTPFWKSRCTFRLALQCALLSIYSRIMLSGSSTLDIWQSFNSVCSYFSASYKLVPRDPADVPMAPIIISRMLLAAYTDNNWLPSETAAMACISICSSYAELIQVVAPPGSNKRSFGQEQALQQLASLLPSIVEPLLKEAVADEESSRDGGNSREDGRNLMHRVALAAAKLVSEPLAAELAASAANIIASQEVASDLAVAFAQDYIETLTSELLKTSVLGAYCAYYTSTVSTCVTHILYSTVVHFCL